MKKYEYRLVISMVLKILKQKISANNLIFHYYVSITKINLK